MDRLTDEYYKQYMVRDTLGSTVNQNDSVSEVSVMAEQDSMEQFNNTELVTP